MPAAAIRRRDRPFDDSPFAIPWVFGYFVIRHSRLNSQVPPQIRPRRALPGGDLLGRADGAGADLDEAVGFGHDLEVMLDHNDGVAFVRASGFGLQPDRRPIPNRSRSDVQHSFSAKR